MESSAYEWHICNKHRYARFQANFIKRRDGKADFWYCPFGNHEIHPPEAGQAQTLLKLTLKGEADV